MALSDRTFKSKKIYKQLISDNKFRDKSEQMIFNMLKNSEGEMRFGERLRRYIYERAGLKDGCEEVPVNVYRQIVMAEFNDRQVPSHIYRETSASLAQLSKMWLTGKGASRESVLLLGFGLGMPLEDVEMFLSKGLLENGLNPKDPLETLCWYCYKNGLSFYSFQDLWEKYLALPEGPYDKSVLSEDSSVFRVTRDNIRTADELMSYLSRLPRSSGKGRSVSAARHFKELCDEAVLLLSELFEAGKAQTEEASGQQTDGDGRSAASMIENILYSTTPRDINGNLRPMNGIFKHIFAGKRLTRQRISELSTGRLAVARYDLITISFLVNALKLSAFLPETKVEEYERQTNAVLSDCGMWPLYEGVPYENFLKMCMSTDDPLLTFSDVFEMCYKNTGFGDTDR